ncbi:MAG: Sirohydrochlorin cobaltochelatase CbiX(small) (EC [uncultured Paraburkholderia sp.]|nr:MAG: Sirohydrochlorin cobaltochelatase CbiX(small) (EC [uncultured Paraburkholderia sp.]CAH2928254.1 MAG: Sirohydrochlorin cobaltochelatase CbiX(small) (EC [uncultured Paraburkholderia sp.]
MATHGMVLFGHGARDVRWREPFERLAVKLRAARDDAGPVSLAFLGLMAPDLPTAIGALVADGCSVVTVVPVFLGQGGHIRRDLPEILDRCRVEFSDVEIRCATAVGEDDGVIDAVVGFCLRQAF